MSGSGGYGVTPGLPRMIGAVLLLLAVYAGINPSSAWAESPLRLMSPEQGWMIELETPALDETEQFSSYQRYRFFGKSDEGFFISLHVEPMLAEVVSPAACREAFFGEGAPALDVIDPSGLTFKAKPRPAVHYSLPINYKGQQLQMPNTHYFFLVNGFCADLHIGASPLYDGGQGKAYGTVARQIQQSIGISIVGHARSEYRAGGD